MSGSMQRYTRIYVQRYMCCAVPIPRFGNEIQKSKRRHVTQLGGCAWAIRFGLNAPRLWHDVSNDDRPQSRLLRCVCKHGVTSSDDERGKVKSWFQSFGPRFFFSHAWSNGCSGLWCLIITERFFIFFPPSMFILLSFSYHEYFTSRHMFKILKGM